MPVRILKGVNMYSGMTVWYRIAEGDFILCDHLIDVRVGDLVPAITAKVYSEADQYPNLQKMSESTFSGIADLYILVPGTPYWKTKVQLDYDLKEYKDNGSQRTWLPEKGKFTNVAPAPLHT